MCLTVFKGRLVIAIVWVFNVPKGLGVKDLILRMALLEGDGTFKIGGLGLGTELNCRALA